MQKQIRRSFQFERATKNTYRYFERMEAQTGNGEVVGVLYVKQTALGAPPPQIINVTIEVPDAQQGGTRPTEGSVLGSEAPRPTA